MEYNLESIEDSLGVYLAAQARAYNEPEQWALDQRWLISELKAAQRKARKLEKVWEWFREESGVLSVGDWGKLHDILKRD